MDILDYDVSCCNCSVRKDFLATILKQKVLHLGLCVPYHKSLPENTFAHILKKKVAAMTNSFKIMNLFVRTNYDGS